MSNNKKDEFKELIQANIDQYGYHVTIVGGAIQPRYAYTIGLTGLVDFELVFAGGINYLQKDLLQIFNEIVIELKKSDDKHVEKVQISSIGGFSLLRVNPSWINLMLLGVIDHYKTTDIKGFQIIPDLTHFTLDIPDMSKKFDPTSEPIWQWLVRKWDYNVPENSTVITNVNALLGEAITEVMRSEENEWEMFAGAGPEVDKNDMRVVSLGTIFGIDSTLLPTMNLEIGKGFWRDSADSEWNNWR